MQETKTKNILAAALLAVALVELLRTAWISDDACITFRSALNFIHGYGATFNIDERVQAYTHPLWFLLVSALTAILGSVFTAAFSLSIAISILVLYLLVTRVATHLLAGAIAVSILLLSKAYVDFSTSGLENPLSHLLILIAIMLGLKAIEGKRTRDQVACLLSCSLLYLSRPDLLILVSPFCLLVLYKNYHSRTKSISVLAIASLPVVIWTIFSLIYYGFPFPNTAYAKLGNGIPLTELIIQGGRYLFDSVSRDPITLAAIASGLFIGFRASAAGMALAAGCVLYLAYVVSIGGDFMSGRFLTAPLLVAVALISRTSFSSARIKALAMLFGVLGAMSINSTILSGRSYSDTYISESGIADERGFWFQRTGLMTAANNNFMTTFISLRWQKNTKTVSVFHGGIGAAGLVQGPGAHLIDACALADPLLARLPAQYEPSWRIGHFKRQLPTDYEKSIEESTNLLTDPVTRSYYDTIRTITRGPLFEAERFREIARINFGLVQKPDWDYYKYVAIPRSSQIPIVEIKTLLDGSSYAGSLNADTPVQFTSALEIALPSRLPPKRMSIDFSLSNNSNYKLEGLGNGAYKPLLKLDSTTSPGGDDKMKMVRYVNTLPATERIKITALQGNGLYSLGHFQVNAVP